MIKTSTGAKIIKKNDKTNLFEHNHNHYILLTNKQSHGPNHDSHPYAYNNLDKHENKSVQNVKYQRKQSDDKIYTEYQFRDNKQSKKQLFSYPYSLN